MTQDMEQITAIIHTEDLEATVRDLMSVTDNPEVSDWEMKKSSND